MNKQLKFLSRAVFGMFLVLFFSVTMIQFVNADELRNNPLNQRTIKNGYKVERGSIIVDGEPVAFSTPTQDTFRYLRNYDPGVLYAPVTGYYSRQQGMTGLEAAMNKELTGNADGQFFTRIQNTLNGVKPQGSSIDTTISGKVQKAAYEAMQEYSFEGAVVAIEPKTGRILALVSTPSYDPNLLSSNDDSEIIANYEALSAEEMQPLMNRAIAGDLYHPGSVYKLVTASAAIESGAAKPSTEFANPASLTLPQSNAVMRNSDQQTCGTGAKASLETAIMYSCNIPIAEMAMGMDKDEVPKMARAFGFEHDLTIPLEVTPSVAPTPLDKAQVALSSIGQLDVRTTPLQVAMVSAAIANGGKVMTPQLVDRVIAPDLRVEQEFDPEELSQPISPETAQAVAGMMEKGVSDSTGFAHLSAIDGVRVAGKTGTAQTGIDANGNDLPYTLWYTGFAPVDDPKVAVAVVIANGGGESFDFQGGSYELPTAVGKRVMEAVLNG
ncbi:MULTISPECIES: peptidoglycan D,D-transpeptidase FtsI family protein [Leucobacter]|uniref:peptidoglycan D,D-transpeptidase FtsI family protein n=1 Tax=Leucobacter TaxID=55968 RepID=UPI000E64B274|nr:penicillin-binding transpeptidase domain-containing protein [Leucobacter aridicollis]UTX53226.1 penicillin-binding protein [Leucobacter aridicollis]